MSKRPCPRPYPLRREPRIDDSWIEAWAVLRESKDDRSFFARIPTDVVFEILHFVSKHYWLSAQFHREAFQMHLAEGDL